MGNSSLGDILGLDSLSFVGGEYTVTENPDLTSLPLSIAMDSIGSNLIISANASLGDLTGLDSLRAIGGYMQIINNESLTSLDGLDSLRAVHEPIEIFNNDMLSDLHGLEHLNSSSFIGAVIENNQALTDCAVESLCNFLAEGGLATISNNAGGCNSTGEVNEACIVAVDNPADGSDIMLYPNPASSIIDIKGLTEDITSVSLFDAQGRYTRVACNGNSINIDALPEGVYLLSIQLKETRIKRRMIKI